MNHVITALQSMIRLCRIQGAERHCLATGMDSRTFAHSAITDHLRDSGFRISADETVTPLYLNETVSFFNDETAREEIGIALPIRDAAPLIGIAAAEYHRLPEAAAAVRTVYRLLNVLVQAVKAGTVSEAVFHGIMAEPLSLLTETDTQDLIVLPPRLTADCVTADARTALLCRHLWVHPDRAQAPLPDAADFLFAALGYACMTAMPPFDTAAEPFGTAPAASPFAPFGKSIDGKPARSCSDAPENSASVHAETIEQLVQNIRDGAFVPVELRCPAVTGTFAALINGGLTVGATPRRTAPPRYEQLCAYRDETQPIVISGADRPDRDTEPVGLPAADGRLQPELDAFIGKARKRINRKRFLQKHTGKIIAAAAGCVLIVAAALFFAHHIMKPPKTAGLSPEAVIRGFYAAVEALDQETVGAYTKNKAGAEYEGLLVHLFVTGKIREAYERKKIYYTPHAFIGLCETVSATGGTEQSPAQLKAAVIATLNGGSVYGISRLTVMPSADADVFDVFFYYWIPLFSSDTTDTLMNETQELSAGRTAFPIQVLRYHDRVRIIEVKNSFFIGAIDPLERSILTESSDAVIEACMVPFEQRPDYARIQADSAPASDREQS